MAFAGERHFIAPALNSDRFLSAVRHVPLHRQGECRVVLEG
ncbi:hypothetical protein ALP44_101564 [Pseudomonas syringae pv. theae]|uniref:Uncharacterized protein n=1 Tax=Pseudomonas syringae pv. theae TaxID=103985 RepID=A0A3M5MSD4_PSESX|nr:hypothetical protein ALP44_101564 [Pseudomonas syringae pv. theae]